MSEWFFSYFMARTITFWWYEWWYPLWPKPKCCIGFLVLVHWNKSTCSDDAPLGLMILIHSDSWSWFWANQQIPIYSLWLDQVSNPQSIVLKVRMLTINSINAVCSGTCHKLMQNSYTYTVSNIHHIQPMLLIVIHVLEYK